MQTNGITTLPEYLRVPRTGRGRTLTKPRRGKVWKVFEEYGSALKDRGKHEWLQVIQETRRYLEKKKESCPTGRSWWTRARTSTPRSGS